jgi:hypothetical protein
MLSIVRANIILTGKPIPNYRRRQLYPSHRDSRLPEPKCSHQPIWQRQRQPPPSIRQRHPERQPQSSLINPVHRHHIRRPLQPPLTYPLKSPSRAASAPPPPTTSSPPASPSLTGTKWTSAAPKALTNPAPQPSPPNPAAAQRPTHPTPPASTTNITCPTAHLPSLASITSTPACPLRRSETRHTRAWTCSAIRIVRAELWATRPLVRAS